MAPLASMIDAVGSSSRTIKTTGAAVPLLAAAANSAPDTTSLDGEANRNTRSANTGSTAKNSLQRRKAAERTVRTHAATAATADRPRARGRTTPDRTCTAASPTNAPIDAPWTTMRHRGATIPATTPTHQTTTGGTSTTASPKSTRSSPSASRNTKVSGLLPNESRTGWAIATPATPISAASRPSSTRRPVALDGAGRPCSSALVSMLVKRPSRGGPRNAHPRGPDRSRTDRRRGPLAGGSGRPVPPWRSERPTRSLSLPLMRTSTRRWGHADVG